MSCNFQSSSYSPAGDLDELERLAYIANDRTALQLIDFAEDAAGIKAEEVRERRADKLCDARGVTELRAELAETIARLRAAEERARAADHLINAVHFVLRPYIGKPEAPPKWAAYLAQISLSASRRLGMY